MATDRDWAEGYLHQARADLAGARAMGPASPSTLAMLWQMVFEKFAKAALLRARALPIARVSTSHRAASRMLQAIRRQKSLSLALGGTKVWEDVLWFIGALEDAHPQLAAPGAPRLEYPWEHVDGTIRWPAKDLQVAKALGDAKSGLGPRVVRFAELMDQRFDSMFP